MNIQHNEDYLFKIFNDLTLYYDRKLHILIVRYHC